jgi:hypothetical protein
MKWGQQDSYLNFEPGPMWKELKEHLRRHADPGGVRHGSLAAGHKRTFIFMIPRKAQAGTFLAPAYGWVPLWQAGRNPKKILAPGIHADHNRKYPFVL